jgi:arylsulfatase A-like enzyme
MQFRPKALHSSVDEEMSPGSKHGSGGLFVITLWFGLVAGWLDLGLALAQRAIHPHVSADILRTNRHFLWMVPVSEVLIFIIVGLSIALLATFRWGLARWTAFRLSVAMSFMTLLLSIEGLHAVASVILACGLGSQIGPWLERRAAGFGRLVRATLPAMAVGLVAFSGLSYERVTSAEHRALALCPPARPGAPNVLLIVLDTVRAECLSLYGHHRPTTPNLERLARRGVVFTQARSTAPWTTPTHASIMTGRWPHELSVRPGVPLDGTFPTLAEVLGREGYATAGFVGNVYYCNAAYGLGRGFARYEDAHENGTVSLMETLQSSGLGRLVNRMFGYPKVLNDGETLHRKSAAVLNRDVLDWFADRPADRPFFVFINYYDAHRPYIFHDDPAARFGMAALPIAEQLDVDKRFLELAGRNPDPSQLTRQFIAEATRITKNAFDLYHDCYDSCIAYLDRQLGLLLNEMERRGLLENTLVIVTSDHGEQLGEHGMVSHGTSVYRQEVHVPLLVISPSSSSRRGVVSEPVSVREIPATVAEWVVPRRRDPFPGRSLMRFLGDGTVLPSETSPVLCELRHNISFPETGDKPSAFRPLRSLVSRGLVYIRGDDGREELYDLVNDPLESMDLAKYSHSRPVIDQFREELNRICQGPIDPAR